MPIAFVGANSVLNSTSGTTTAVPMPTAMVTGNVVYVIIASVGNSPTPTPPSGWTLVSSFSPGTTLTSYLYRDRTYRVLINGRTGEVLGDRPYSVWKILALVLFVLAVLAAA